jgi:hypothetical protein
MSRFGRISLSFAILALLVTFAIAWPATWGWFSDATTWAPKHLISTLLLILYMGSLLAAVILLAATLWRERR